VRRRRVAAALVAGVVTIIAGSLSAEQRQIAPGQPSIMEEEDETPPPQQQAPPVKPTYRTEAPKAEPPPPDMNLDADDQLAPSQIKQPMPAAVSIPGDATGHAMPRSEKQARSTSLRTVVACSGSFAKDSTNLALAMAFDSRNVVFTEVDAPGGAKVPASVLFPKDPNRRLEVWWSNAANRSGIYLIVINGKSAWTAPGGMRLGLTLAQLEKLNHKTFKLKGFDKDDVATVSDWDGGVLATLPGGCRSGVSLRAQSSIPGEVTGALSADHEYNSSDPAMKAVNPSVSEILIGY
jgi:hypothetical protein